MMLPPFLTVFILFLVVFTIARTRAAQREKAQEQAFWNRELEANSTARKDISNLSYIAIPMAELPFGVAPEDAALCACEERIREFSEKKILNLTGLSNTDLKLKYGAPNLTFLSECDQNFTLLIQVMQAWGKRLIELSLQKEAETVLYYAVRWGSDMKSTYLMLADIYRETNNDKGLRALTEYASLLNSLRKEAIQKALQDL